MRKIIIGMLMAATAATPVLAQDNNDGWRGRGHRDGGEQRSEQRSEQRAERVQERQQAREQRQQAAQQPQAAPQQVERQAYRQRQAEAPVQQQQAVQQQAYRTRQTGTWNRGGGDTGQRDAYRQQIEQSRRSNEQVRAGMPENYQRRAVENERRYEGQVQGQYRRDNNRDSYRGDRNGTRDYSRGSYGGNYNGSYNGGRNTDWNRNWRSDNRYDWQRYRYQNRSVYRPGRYYSPYRNYSYNRLGIGVVLDQLFFGRNYWIADPWQYRLPPAPYGTQWVRYFDDVVLVDVYTGQVLDVIYDFFW